jgi:hypothetical protein
MTDNIENPIADDTSRTDSSNQEQDPEGPFRPSRPPMTGSGHRPATQPPQYARGSRRTQRDRRDR